MTSSLVQSHTFLMSLLSQNTGKANLLSLCGLDDSCCIALMKSEEPETSPIPLFVGNPYRTHAACSIFLQ